MGHYFPVGRVILTLIEGGQEPVKGAYTGEFREQSRKKSLPFYKKPGLIKYT
jgi:hypothetical protein